jgi:predicted ArsR family transcriptional regulator
MVGVPVERPDRDTTRPATPGDPERPGERRETRERLIEAISTLGPVTAKTLATRFGLTSAAVRRHLTSLQADGVIEEHEAPVARRGRGRPSKSYVLSNQAHERLGSEYDDLANLAVTELARRGGPEALEHLACARVAPWEAEFERRVAAAEQDQADGAGEHDTPVTGLSRAQRVQILADLLTERGYAATVRPLTVTLPATATTPRPRTVETAQLVQGHCPIQDVASRHPELCEAEARAISRMVGSPVQRLATLAGGAHACTTHIPLTEGKTR